MQDNLQKITNKYERSHVRKKRWQKVVAALASVTVFCTTYALILPAVTMERTVYCGLEEHAAHTDSCYEKVLVCPLSEEGHVHTEACLNEAGEYICGLTEGEVTHRHDESCYELSPVPTCGLPIHEHTLQCYSDPEADVESRAFWEGTLGTVTGNYAKDVLSMARSQLEYKESSKNYLVLEDGTTKNGYTRYGAWYGDPYGDWNSMFTSFCVYYGGVPGSVAPTAGTVKEWIASVSGSERYVTGQPEKAAAGDIVFLDTNGDGVPDVSAVAAEVNGDKLAVIQGDADGEVKTLSYALTQVTGFIDLTEEPAEAETVGEGEEPALTGEETAEETPEAAGEETADGEEPALTEEETTGEDPEAAGEEADGEEPAPTEEMTGEDPEAAGEEADGEEPALTEEEMTEEDPEAAGEAEEMTEVSEPYSICAEATDGAQVTVSGLLPEGAEVTIVPVTLTREDVSTYLGSDISVREYVAYDITIYVDGEEWQPDETVSVTISKPSIQIDEEDKLDVAHVDADGNTQNIGAEVTSEGDVQFDADGFSLYIIYTYTVDFHYNDFTYSIKGGDRILLSDLFSALGVDAELSRVTDVSFSDETLIRVERLDYEDGSHDWRLFSLQAFDTAEELTITLDDGSVILIHVTDDKPTGSSDPLEPVAAPDYIGNYPTGLRSTEWQITKQEYRGNKQTDKIPVDSDGDGKTDVYLQKNVVPTDVENEFRVYLSIDKRMTMEQFLNLSRIAITTSHSYANDQPGTIYKSIHGNFTSELSEHDNQGTYSNKYYVKLNVYETTNSSTPLYVYYDWRYGNTSNCSQGTVFLVLPGELYIVIANSVNFHGTEGTGTGNPFELNLYLDQVPNEFTLYNTVLRNVTDVIGDQVEVIDFENNHTCDGTASYDDATRTITWNPVDNSSVIPEVPPKSPFKAWYENVAQLVYKVRLNVLDDDFVPCADTVGSTPSTSTIAASIAAGESFKVNNSAVLTYDKVALPNTTGVQSTYGLEAVFPVPEVRGLLYDITFIKLNEEGRQLAGAVFGIYQSDGTTPVLDENGDPYTVTTTTTGVSRFEGLPFGNYVVKEIKAPPHYNIPQQNAWQMRLCYTDSWALLEQDVSPYQLNMRYKGNDTNGQWRITDPRKPFWYNVEVFKVDENGDPLEGAGFSLPNPSGSGTLTGSTGQDGTYYFDAHFSADVAYILSEIAPPGGYFSLPKNIQFRVNEDKTTDTYTAEFINEDEFDGTVSIELVEVGSGDDVTYVLKVKVQNEPIYELPHTGGTGTLLYTLSGIALLGTALVAGFASRRKHERRANG